MTIEQQLSDLKNKSDKLNALKIENELKLKNLEEDKEKLLIEAKELNIDPSMIEQILQQEEAAFQNEVAKLDTELTGMLDEISKI